MNLSKISQPFTFVCFRVTLLFSLFTFTGIDAPRNSAVIDSSLPSARVVSTNFHSVSGPEDCQYKFVHLTSLFGIFLGHDLFDYQAFPILESK